MCASWSSKELPNAAILTNMYECSLHIQTYYNKKSNFFITAPPSMNINKTVKIRLQWGQICKSESLVPYQKDSHVSPGARNHSDIPLAATLDITHVKRRSRGAITKWMLPHGEDIWYFPPQRRPMGIKVALMLCVTPACHGFPQVLIISSEGLLWQHYWLTLRLAV